MNFALLDLSYQPFPSRNIKIQSARLCDPWQTPPQFSRVSLIKLRESIPASFAISTLVVIAGPDPNDNFTLVQPQPVPDFTKSLDKNALKGKRIGVPRKVFLNNSITGNVRGVLEDDIYEELNGSIGPQHHAGL